MRRALLFILAPACTLVRDLDDLPGDGAASTGASCDFSATGGSTAGNAITGDPVQGCADGTRELFLDVMAQPDIAGCSGGFSIPGTVTQESRTPHCGRNAGNDGAEPIGWGCSAADLCSEGWHVCESAAEVAFKSTTGVCAEDNVGFWATRQSQDRTGTCVPADTNNLVGCGLADGDAPDPSCAPLTHELREINCNESCAWICDGAVVWNEAHIVQKYGSQDGGVLCCTD